MAPPERAKTYAAVDLGSNSFHLLVARRTHGELRVLDRIKDTVRLGGGLDQDGNLDPLTRDAALESLARFGQRLRGIPAENIRAVGTQTFRRLKNANAFLLVAETALGCPVDIIAGREEARLIYLGVSQGVSGHTDRRLVIDIGGGSTELVIGEGLATIELESLQFGCVSLTRWHFGDGSISRERWQKARREVLAELQEIQNRYRETGWETAIGSSGTIRAIGAICLERGWTERDITVEALQKLVDEFLSFRRIEDIDFPSMSERRRSVIAGGLVMLSACFEALKLEGLTVSPFALREGVLHDLLGRQENRDPRDKTVEAFMARYSVDDAQAKRVARVALKAFRALQQDLDLHQGHLSLLTWAAYLHETGLGISHSHYQQHSGYLVQESDMAGFSRQEQAFLAALVRHHRRAIPAHYAAGLPARLRRPLRYTLFMIRFAWILSRTRDDNAVPVFDLNFTNEQIVVSLDQQWVELHPLTMTDLELERVQLDTVGIQLEIRQRERPA
ncbi:MAG: Ppx/GppA family phosphatase [Xanthomonadales bacterium]|nr:Ppx/GppA family phosphatase [Xanthomonadales bacterium]